MSNFGREHCKNKFHQNNSGKTQNNFGSNQFLYKFNAIPEKRARLKLPIFNVFSS